MKDYVTVKGETTVEMVIERSRFIAYVSNVETEEQAKAFIDKIRKMHPFATHNCYAYVLGANSEKQKFSDDGEPQGTAGLPMLDVIKKKEIVDVCVVVTRYFGGIKLGAGGLVRAYSSSASDGLNNATKVKYTVSCESEIKLSYEKYSKLLKFFENKKVVIIDTVFDTDITVKVVTPEDVFENYSKELSDYFSGTVYLNKTNTVHYPFQV